MKAWTKTVVSVMGAGALVIGSVAAPAAAAPKDRHTVVLGGETHYGLTAGQAASIVNRHCGEGPAKHKRFFDESEYRDQGLLWCEDNGGGLFKWVNSGPKK